LPQALTLLVELSGQRINEVAAVHQPRGAEQGLLILIMAVFVNRGHAVPTGDEYPVGENGEMCIHRRSRPLAPSLAITHAGFFRWGHFL
jgi:hypothetical protein